MYQIESNFARSKPANADYLRQDSIDQVGVDQVLVEHVARTTSV